MRHFYLSYSIKQEVIRQSIQYKPSGNYQICQKDKPLVLRGNKCHITRQY